jgi:hypothetical protein
MVCPSCYSPHLRLSKFRSRDIAQLFVLRYPVRCRTCGERTYSNLLRALTLRHGRLHRATAKVADGVNKKTGLR